MQAKPKDSAKVSEKKDKMLVICSSKVVSFSQKAKKIQENDSNTIIRKNAENEVSAKFCCVLNQSY